MGGLPLIRTDSEPSSSIFRGCSLSEVNLYIGDLIDAVLPTVVS